MHKPYSISASTIVGEDKNYTDSTLLIENGRISKIVDGTIDDYGLLEFSGSTIVPGLIDLHIHGRKGCDVMDGKMSSLNTISNSLAKHGVTGFLATTVTSSWVETLTAMDILGQAAKTKMPGAAVLGGYSEGLFFTKDHKGAHDEECFLDLNVERVDALIDAAHGQLRVIALAPEVENATEVIQHITDRGVKVMLGHTNATYSETVDAIKAGASGGVHVFNGMRGIHHREPGCTGAVLTENCSVEVIADGVHLHPAILKMICKLKAVDDITLISDCINAGGMADGLYTLGKLQVDVANGIARTKAGSLAGSTLTLEKAVKNMVTLADVEFRDAVHMASLSPAKFLEIDDKRGSIKEAKDADLCVIGDAGEVEMTIISGEIVYQKNNQ
jgi:N-acetylgalactosamine-6-phosphate deacetylase